MPLERRERSAGSSLAATPEKLKMVVADGMDAAGILETRNWKVQAEGLADEDEMWCHGREKKLR